MGTSEPDAIDKMHDPRDYYYPQTELTNYINVRKVGGGYLRAKKRITTELPLGNLFVGRHCLHWNEEIWGVAMRASMFPAFQNGFKAWLLQYHDNPVSTPWVERILNFETGKELWLKHKASA